MSCLTQRRYPPLEAFDYVERALAAVYAARIERASLIQAYSRQQAKPGTSDAGKVTLNPREFMDYNCNYEGCQSWLARQAAHHSNKDHTPAASSLFDAVAPAAVPSS